MATEAKENTKKKARQTPKPAPERKAAGNGKDLEPAEYEPGSGEQQFIGQGTSASTAPKVIQPLIDLAKRHEGTKAQLKKLKQKKSDEDAEGLILFGKHQKYFTETDKAFIYDGGAGVQIIIQKKGIQFETKAVPTAQSLKDDAKAGS